MKCKYLMFGDFSEMKYGKMPRKDGVKDIGKYPVYSGYRIVGYYDEYNVDEPTLIVVARGVGGTGDVKISPSKCWLTNLSISVVVDENVAIKEYLYYYFKVHNLRYLDSGSAQSQITISDLSRKEIILPTIDVQKKIVKFLKCFDDKIDNNTAINRNLSEQAKILFKERFTKDIMMLEGWQELTLGDVATLSAGGDKPQVVSEYVTNSCTVPIYSNGISNEGLYGYTEKAKILEESVTVSARGTIGYVCLRQEPYVPIVRLISVVPNMEIMTAKYIYLWLESLHIMGTGTTQQQLTVPYFRKTRIVVPPFSVVKNFTELVNPMYDIILKNKHENMKLANLRDSLLPKLMSGEIDVSNIKI